jgi:hypothetical protein
VQVTFKTGSGTAGVSTANDTAIISDLGSSSGSFYAVAREGDAPRVRRAKF